VAAGLFIFVFFTNRARPAVFISSRTLPRQAGPEAEAEAGHALHSLPSRSVRNLEVNNRRILFVSTILCDDPTTCTIGCCNCFLVLGVRVCVGRLVTAGDGAF
jgi:hypothetical protein